MQWHLVRSVLCKCHPRGSPVLTPHSLPVPPSGRTLAPAHVAARQDCVVLTAESTRWVCLVPFIQSPVGALSLYYFPNKRKIKLTFKMETSELV